MAKTMKLDFTGVESFQKVPEGVHVMEVGECTLEKNRNGNAQLIMELSHESGATMKHYQTITKPSLWAMKLILEALGFDASGPFTLDVSKLKGKKAKCTIIHSEPNEDGKSYANVEAWAPVGDYDSEDEVPADGDDDDFGDLL